MKNKKINTEILLWTFWVWTLSFLCYLPMLLDKNGVHIPKGQWHTVEVIEPSAILEVKEGPYTPLSPEDIMD